MVKQLPLQLTFTKIHVKLLIHSTRWLNFIKLESISWSKARSKQKHKTNQFMVFCMW